MSVPFSITIWARAKKLYEPLRKIWKLKLGVIISRINSHQTSWSIIPNVPQLCAVCLYSPPLKIIRNFTILQLLPTFKTTKSIWHHRWCYTLCKCMYAFFHLTSIFCSCNQNGTFTNARWPDISTETTNIIIAMNKNSKL